MKKKLATLWSKVRPWALPYLSLDIDLGPWFRISTELMSTRVENMTTTYIALYVRVFKWAQHIRLYQPIQTETLLAEMRKGQKLVRELKQMRESIEILIPPTYYADRPLEERVLRLIQEWRTLKAQESKELDAALCPPAMGVSEHAPEFPFTAPSRFPSPPAIIAILCLLLALAVLLAF